MNKKNPHKRRTGKCIRCSVFHTISQHRFHGLGSFLATHKLKKNRGRSNRGRSRRGRA